MNIIAISIYLVSLERYFWGHIETGYFDPNFYVMIILEKYIPLKQWHA